MSGDVPYENAFIQFHVHGPLDVVVHVTSLERPLAPRVCYVIWALLVEVETIRWLRAAAAGSKRRRERASRSERSERIRCHACGLNEPGRPSA
jgi:hypothetical protein